MTTLTFHQPKAKPHIPESGGSNVAGCGGALTLTMFNYAELKDADLRQEFQHAAKAIESHLSMMKKRAVEIGRILRGLKGKLPHGTFGRWLHTHFGMSHRTAQNFMIAAHLCDKYEKFSYLPNATLYLLGAPSTPNWVAKELNQKLVAGEPAPSVAEVKGIMAEAKAVEILPPAKCKATSDTKIKSAKTKVAVTKPAKPAAAKQLKISELTSRSREAGLDAAMQAMEKAFPDINMTVEPAAPAMEAA